MIPHGMVQMMADRYVYAPIVVAAPLVAGCLLSGFDQMLAVDGSVDSKQTTAAGRRQQAGPTGLVRWTTLLSVVVVATAALLTSRQLTIWGSMRTMLNYSLQYVEQRLCVVWRHCALGADAQLCCVRVVSVSRGWLRPYPAMVRMDPLDWRIHGISADLALDNCT